jgi:Secretion system C-terminal sorting domain
MRKFLCAFSFLLCSLITHAQLCPGGGVDFANVVTFDQSWIQGCLTGTSCNGGIGFDNRAGCEPTTAMDACAPAPSCTSEINGSDLWFRFYATGTTAAINVIQQVSFIAVIQAFSGGPACGGLTQIGCAISGGPSSGVVLNLSGLTLGGTYYFRIFGSSNSAAQRTGTFCFCGSAALGSSVLPVVLTEFKAVAQKNKVILKWTTASETDNRSFELERSTNGTSFSPVTTVNGNGTTQTSSLYEYTDAMAVKGNNYYRLKITDANGRHSFSDIRVARIDYGKLISVFNNPVKGNLVIDASAPTKVVLMNMSGQQVQTVQLIQGRNMIPVSHLNTGNYLIKSVQDNETYKISIVQ